MKRKANAPFDSGLHYSFRREKNITRKAPAATRAINPSQIPGLLPSAAGGTAVAAGLPAGRVGTNVAVEVGGGSRVAVAAAGVAVGGPGVWVGVAGGVTCKSSFWLSLKTEVPSNPFQVIRSINLTS